MDANSLYPHAREALKAIDKGEYPKARDIINQMAEIMDMSQKLGVDKSAIAEMAEIVLSLWTELERREPSVHDATILKIRDTIQPEYPPYPIQRETITIPPAPWTQPVPWTDPATAPYKYCWDKDRWDTDPYYPTVTSIR